MWYNPISELKSKEDMLQNSGKLLPQIQLFNKISLVMYTYSTSKTIDHLFYSACVIVIHFQMKLRRVNPRHKKIAVGAGV
jgi:hypothetical protein